MRAFDDGIEQMLWPEKRDVDLVLGNKVPGRIDRTTTSSYLRVPAGYLPAGLRQLLKAAEPFAAEIDKDGGLAIGPIPKGTPVNLLANLNLLSESRDLDHDKKVVDLLVKVKVALKSLPKGASDEEASKVFAPLVAPLLELNKCPDFVVNRGHYFGTAYFDQEPGLSDPDKRALIEFLKTF